MKIGDVIVLLILLGVLGGALYMLYLNWPTEPVKFIDSDNDTIPEVSNHTLDNSTSRSKQFYPNLRFPDKEITFKIEGDCPADRREQMIEAFDIIESRTVLSFNEELTNPQVVVTCSEVAPEPDQRGHFIAGEGGPTEIINTSLYAVAFAGKISLFRPERCDTPHIAIHELLHVLGFDHNTNPNSILYPTLDCEQEIDSYLLEEIDELYSVPGRPDLTVKEIDATKSGRYLNFEIKVENQGLKNAEKIKMEVYADDRLVSDFDLGSIEVGTTKILTVENLKISRSTEEVRFVVDSDNSILELYEDNNQKILVLNE